jgi:hypothetical protein
LTAHHAEAVPSTTLAESVLALNTMQVADTRQLVGSLPRLESLTVAELSTRNATDFSADVFTAAKSGFTTDVAATGLVAESNLQLLRRAAGNPELDFVLLFAVLLGLVAFQLRRAQDSLQRPFTNV